MSNSNDNSNDSSMDSSMDNSNDIIAVQGTNVRQEPVMVMQERWDYLIVLDACRYDYFEKVWRNYFETGRLSRRSSIGAATLEWRDKSFTGFYDDVVYVSANPYINSVKAIGGFLGSEHFHKVYDVWQRHWDEEFGTVRPGVVTRAALGVLKKHKDKRLIIHYLQPHAPYLSLEGKTAGFPIPNMETDSVIWGIRGLRADSKFQRKALRWLLPLFKKNHILGDHPEWFLRQFLRMNPKTPMDAVRRQHGRKGLVRAYRANLELVMIQVARLVEHLSGRIVITADHGEQLGEGRCYTHPGGSDSPYLRDVPWLEIERSAEDCQLPAEMSGNAELGRADGQGDGSIIRDGDTRGDQEKIEARLRALGYVD